jgi:hypothetical protein
MSSDIKPGEVTATITFALSLAFFLFISTCAGCGTPAPPYCDAPDVSYTEAAIVNGEPSTDRRGTVYVQGNGSACTGTVIGPHTVLTAAHCEGMTDILVEDVAWFDVVENYEHPDYFFPNADLRILHTEETLPEPYITIGLRDEPCYSLTVQGYGIGSNGKLHERRVEEIDHGWGIIRATEGICNGDSGGPLYGHQHLGVVTLIGVSSFGLNEPYVCEGGQTGFVDLNEPSNGDWVRSNIK